MFFLPLTIGRWKKKVRQHVIVIYLLPTVFWFSIFVYIMFVKLFLFEISYAYINKTELLHFTLQSAWNFLCFDLKRALYITNFVVIKQIGLPLRGRPILLITRMITDRIGLHSVLLPLQIILINIYLLLEDLYIGSTWHPVWPTL